MKNQKITIGLISLGCSKNRVDSERILALLQISGFKLSSDMGDCEVIIVNTCGFIKEARDESIETILELSELKKNGNKLKLIVVTGCMAERYKESLKKELPEIDIVLGLGAENKIDEIILSELNGSKETKKDYFPVKKDLLMCGKRVLTTPKYYAYLKIADGCNNRCSYCAIPMIRGNYVSVKKEIIIEEAKNLVKNGAKELILIAQDVTSYGLDLYQRLALPELLRELSKIKGLKWIRLLYCYPDKITDELIKEMAENDKVIKYIDIPLQHINNDMLKKMNRKGSKQLIVGVINKLREKIPNIIIRSTFIVGFPGETQEQFEELLKFISEIKLERVGCFKYSREKGTVAYNFKDQIEEQIKDQRYELLMKAQDKVNEEVEKRQRGLLIEVMIEGYDDKSGMYYGRSYMDSPEIDNYIEFEIDNNYREKIPELGDFLKIRL